MTVEFEAGYSLPTADEPLKHARVLHGKNRFEIKTVTATEETAAGPGTSADNGLTYEVWQPFSNQVPSPADYSTEWAASGVTISSDNQTLDEGTGTGVHRIGDAVTLTTDEWILAVRAQRQTVTEIRVRALGTNDHWAYFDIAAGTVGTTNNANGTIIDNGNGEFLCLIYFTPASASSHTLYIELSNGSENTSYTGSNNTVRVREVIAHKSTAILTYEGYVSQEADVMCIGAHNFGSRGGRFHFRYGSSPTTIKVVDPDTDAPIMLIFEPVTDDTWSLLIQRSALPRIGVFWVGKALQMERPFYAGFSPSRMARQTMVTGNMSEGGEWLGRSRIRTMSAVQYQWANLSYSWVRTNLDTPNGLIQALEVDPFFLAWRPGETDDVDYAWTTGAVDPPSTDGTRDLMSWGFQAEVYGYE